MISSHLQWGTLDSVLEFEKAPGGRQATHKEYWLKFKMEFSAPCEGYQPLDMYVVTPSHDRNKSVFKAEESFA